VYKTKEGLPLGTISEDVKPDDEWGLFRLTDDGVRIYKEGAELAAGIMGIYCKEERVVKEVMRRKKRSQAEEEWKKLPKAERERTLIRAVRPK